MSYRNELPPVGHPDRLPGAMVEAVTEYDWAELPEYIKDSLRAACKQFAHWADNEQSPIPGELANEIDA